eukprot:TRINITY_DN6510_c0_g1_i1.p1 TRINITY_DN6510_c0_g1~~TRINITY_DN6510_c0_g1_i1.p1  ORF type:complete len:320 (+),score=88.78 TRINITY_DN6510_c0_g1_i1:25-960(+)
MSTLADFWNDFQLTNTVLGCGSQCKVFLGYSTASAQPVAIKVFLPHAKPTRRDVPEIFRRLDKVQGVSRLIRAYATAPQAKDQADFCEETIKQVQVFELLDGQDLCEFYLKFRVYSPGQATVERLSRGIFKKVVSALADVHQLGIAHLDLKMENVMYSPSSKRVTLIDFGFAVTVDPSDEEACSERAGTLEYCAPEIIHSTARYEPRKADIWSIGVLLYVMLFGRFPFAARVPPAQPVTVELPPGTGDQLKDLFAKIFQMNPAERLDAEGVLAHPWMCMADQPSSRMSSKFKWLAKELSQLFKTNKGAQVM